jgi:hypothetical protein
MPMIILTQKEVVSRKRLKFYEVDWNQKDNYYQQRNRVPRNKGRIKENQLHLVSNGTGGWDDGIKDFFPYYMVKKGGKYYFFEPVDDDIFNEILIKCDGDVLQAAELMESYDRL